MLDGNFGLACSLGQLGMENEREEPGWEVWLGGGRCAGPLAILVPSSTAVPLVLPYCWRRDEGVAVFNFTSQLV